MRRKQLAVITAAAVVGISAVFGLSAAAEEDRDTYERVLAIVLDNATDELWETVAMTNDEIVGTGVNVRETEDGEVIACLYPGGAAEVLEKGEEWSKIRSGKVTGYVKNEFLVFGKDTQDMIEYYGLPGVVTSWDDVRIYEAPDGESTVVHIAEAGEKYEIVEDEGHWFAIIYGESPDEIVAYVPKDEVIQVLLVGAAVPLNEEEEDTEEEVYEDDESSDEYYEEPSGDDYYDEPSYTPTPDPGPSTPPATEPPVQEPPATDAPNTEAPDTDVPEVPDVPEITESPGDSEDPGDEENPGEDEPADPENPGEDEPADPGNPGEDGPGDTEPSVPGPDGSDSEDPGDAGDGEYNDNVPPPDGSDDNVTEV